jgi:hypothetical protein
VFSNFNGGLGMKKLSFLSILFLLGFSSLKPIQINCFTETNIYFNHLSMNAEHIARSVAQINDVTEKVTVIIGTVGDLLRNVQGQGNRVTVDFKVNQSAGSSSFNEFKDYIPFRILTDIFAQFIKLDFSVQGHDNLKYFLQPNARDNAWEFHENLCKNIFNIQEFDENHNRILNGYKRLVETAAQGVVGVRVERDGFDIGFNLPDMPQDQVLQLLKLRKKISFRNKIITLGSLLAGYGYCAWDLYDQMSRRALMCQTCTAHPRDFCKENTEWMNQGLSDVFIESTGSKVIFTTLYLVALVIILKRF